MSDESYTELRDWIRARVSLKPDIRGDGFTMKTDTYYGDIPEYDEQAPSEEDLTKPSSDW